MKKLLLLSFFIVSSTVMTSCTADAIPEHVQPITHADDPGGQQGVPPPPPPPPPTQGGGIGG